MLKNKKAQGLPITTIILVVIGLIVLVVLIAVFTGRLGVFSKELKESTLCAEACKALGKTGAENANCPATSTKLPGDYKEGSNCCCT